MSVAVYQCVKIGDTWHLTQEQATPPLPARLASYTSCGKWAEFKFGFEKRRPACPECMRHVAVWERKQKGTAFDWMDQVGEPLDDDDE